MVESGAQRVHEVPVLPASYPISSHRDVGKDLRSVGPVVDVLEVR